MNFEKTLKQNNINYKDQEYEDDIIIYRIENKCNLVLMLGQSSIFSIDRDLFYYLNNQKLYYSFVLINKNEDKVFYLEFKEQNNWLNSSFERSDKEQLYFGKIVLNNQIKESDLVKKIKRY